MEKLKTSCSQVIDTTYINEKGLFSFFKRVCDIIISFIGIIVMSPVFIIVSLIIRMTSKGSAIFAHKRLGKGGKFINVYKFRTMVQDAEDLLNKLTPEQKREFEINFKLENDPRVTKIGAFLRKTSLDELPQLFNILIGNMTLVGPRPIVEKELMKYGMYSEKLLSVKPGLTGNWQANGRSDTTYDERIGLDMQYIDNRSLLFDLKIIAKTFIVVLKREGAR